MRDSRDSPRRGKDKRAIGENDMGEPSQPVRLGNVFFPNADWLARHQPEAILEPDLPILDPHHHLWERADHRYFLPDLLADLASGHNVVGTVFVECMRCTVLTVLPNCGRSARPNSSTASPP